MKKAKHPIQPVVLDDRGHARFKPNAIARMLLDAGPFDLNKIALMNFPREDQEQLAQLIGYSVSGFSELEYVSDEVFDAAQAQVDALIDPASKSREDLKPGARECWAVVDSYHTIVPCQDEEDAKLTLVDWKKANPEAEWAIVIRYFEVRE